MCAKLNLNQRIELSRHYLESKLDEVEIALEHIGKGITECGSAIDKAQSSEWQEFIEAVVDEKTNTIEVLLGCAFVICQTHIIAVTRIICRLRLGVSNDRKAARKLKHSVMHSYSPDVVPGITRIEAIDALSNYFKHRNEWAYDWRNAAMHTRRSVEELGLTPSSSGNLRSGAEVLGNPGYDNTVHFVEILREWQTETIDAYETELKDKGM